MMCVNYIVLHIYFELVCEVQSTDKIVRPPKISHQLVKKSATLQRICRTSKAGSFPFKNKRSLIEFIYIVNVTLLAAVHSVGHKYPDGCEGSCLH